LPAISQLAAHQHYQSVNSLNGNAGNYIQQNIIQQNIIQQPRAIASFETPSGIQINPNFVQPGATASKAFVSTSLSGGAALNGYAAPALNP